MENSLYHRVRGETNEDRDIHKSLVEDIETRRDRKENEAYRDPYNIMLDSSKPLLSERAYIDIKGPEMLKEHDFYFTKKFLRNKSDYIGKAVRN